MKALGGDLDASFLRSIAETGVGRVHLVADPTKLVAIFQGEVDEARK